MPLIFQCIDFNSCPWLRGGICGTGPSHRFSDTARDITSSITMVVTGELTTQSDVLGFVLPRSHMCWAFVFFFERYLMPFYGA